MYAREVGSSFVSSSRLERIAQLRGCELTEMDFHPELVHWRVFCLLSDVIALLNVNMF